MHMSEKSPFTRHSNIFDDDFFPGKLQSYRKAKILNVPTNSLVSDGFRSSQALKSSVEFGKLNMSGVQFESKFTLTTQAEGQNNFHSQINLETMASSVLFNPNLETSGNLLPWESVNKNDQAGVKELEVIPEVEDKSLESSKVAEKDDKDEQIKEESENDHVDHILLSQSVAFFPSNTETIQAKKYSHHSINNLTIEETQESQKAPEEDDSPQKQQFEEAIIEEEMEVEGTEPVEFPMPESESEVENENSFREEIQEESVVNTIRKVETEDKCIETEEFVVEQPPVEEKEEIILSDKAIDTFGLVRIQEFGCQIEPVVEEEAIIISSQDTVPFEEEMENENDFQAEEIKAMQEIDNLKTHFLSQLGNMKEKIQKVKSKQSQVKENVCNALNKTVNGLTQLVQTSLQSFLEKRVNIQKKNILSYQLKVTKLKKELDDLKNLFVFTTENLKDEIGKLIKEDTKGYLAKVVEETLKEREKEKEKERSPIAAEIRIQHDIFDNHSITTNSSLATPVKVSTGTEPISSAKQRRSQRRHRRDPAVLEGMLYLLDHGCLNNPFKEKEEFRKSFEAFLKKNEQSKVTDDLILSSLVERTRADEEKTSVSKRKGSVSKGEFEAIEHNEGETPLKDKEEILRSGKESLRKKIKK